MIQLVSLWALLSTAAPVEAAAAPHPCPGPFGELVGTRKIARGIAEAIIRSRETPATIARYRLHVGKDQEDSGKWAVWQGLPDLPSRTNGAIWVRSGGGGMEMRIDKCNGQVSDLHYMR